MAFIEPMHRNKPNITYLLTADFSLKPDAAPWKQQGSSLLPTKFQGKRPDHLKQTPTGLDRVPPWLLE